MSTTREALADLVRMIKSAEHKELFDEDHYGSDQQITIHGDWYAITMREAEVALAARPEASERAEKADEYHSMDDLYEHRFALTRALVALMPQKCVKCKTNGDGSVWEGFFVVYIETPAGQVSYHYKMAHWDELPCREVERWHYDGHTPEITLTRLASITPAPEQGERMLGEALFVLEKLLDAHKRLAAGFGLPYEEDVAIAEYAERVIADLKQGEKALQEVLRKVRAHTGLPSQPTVDLLLGLLASIERITDRALLTRQSAEEPETTCPKCGHEEPDLDGFGFVYCPACGFCRHPNKTLVGEKWICGVCGKEAPKPAERMPCEEAPDGQC